MSPLKITPENAELAYLQTKYGLTPKQAAYALATLREPQKSIGERGREAGYSDGAIYGDGGRVLKSTEVGEAIEAERDALQRKIEAFGKAIATDPRLAIQNKLIEHTERFDVTANQTRATELLGKMHGVFIERVELDAGPHTRARFADEVLEKMTNVSQEKE